LRPQQGAGSLESSRRGVAAVVDCPNRWVALDPERGGMAAVAEAARNLSCVGAEPLAVTDNLNFPSPETPTGYWQFAMACRGLAEACTALATPVTGGNVSLYNETRLPDGRLQPIHPTPVVGMVGLVTDLAQVRGLAWRQADDGIWLLGVPPGDASEERVGLAGSSYQGVIHGLLCGRPPRVDLDLERRVQGLLRQAIAADLVASAHDLSDGGLAVALAEACIASGMGAQVAVPSSAERCDRLLFGEGGARVLVAVPQEREGAWQALLAEVFPGEAPVPATRLGTVTASADLVMRQGEAVVLHLPVNQMGEAYEQALPRRMRQAGLPPDR
ncbi:MAG: AIR synthase related protein, partial [Cyanobacteriota bacterium]|nr:AIR synthase related protein [Cyanobacteriota bacterium]